MGFDAWVTLAALVGAISAMVSGRPPDIVLVGGLTVLLAFGVLTPAEALAGFSNEGMLTVGVLFVIAAGIRQTGAMDEFLRRALGAPKTVGVAQMRMMLPVALVSAFVNNTPVVAIVLPVVMDWTRRAGLVASKVLIPLSYAAILGGTCTLIGTSTNLVVSGLAKAHDPPVHIGMFDITVLGVPVLVAGISYVLLAGRRLLPERKDAATDPEQLREYVVAMRVEAGSPIIGRTIEQAGLRHLPGLFLVEVQRDGDVMPAVEPDTVLEENDHLLFAGALDSVVDLRRVRGLVPATSSSRVENRSDRRLIEVVVAARSTLAGLSIRETRFRTKYEAAVIAVHRGGERITGKIGDIVLRPGDVLLVEARRSFLRLHGGDRSFALLREVSGSAPPRHERAWVAALAAVSMVLASALDILPLITAALLAAGVLILTRCLTSAEAIESLELRVLIAIAAAFALGRAIEKTGLATLIGTGMVEVAGGLGVIGIVAGLYLATAVLTELITNNSAAALMFPFAMAISASGGIDPKPLLLVVMMAASASFSTPIGYQTNLMVYGPGRYRFTDFIRFGAPLQIIVGTTTIVVTSLMWF
jgi:di/tricarboxylate transporter